MALWYTALLLLVMADEEERINAICDAYDQDEEEREESRYLFGY